MKAGYRGALELAASVFICESAGIIGSIFTVSSVSTWYPTLEKPWFNPPSWVFGPVWTTLYLMMGVSLYLVWRRRPTTNIKPQLWVFAAQLFLNTLWSIAFFGLKSPLAGLAVIVPLWIAIAMTINSFKAVSKPAAALLAPYIMWVGFAAALNLSILLLNP